MATVTAAITLSSAAGDLITDALSLSDSKGITITDMVTSGLGRGKITATSKGASGEITLYTNGDYTAQNTYLYVKNTDATSTDYIYIYDDETGGDPVWMTLRGGEWAFLPINYQATLKAYAATTNTIVEWMVFGAQ